jgi:hypothetical protein
MINTIRKVMMVVPVLITSCQVLFSPKSGPLKAHNKIMATAAMNTQGRPKTDETVLVKRVKKSCLLELWRFRMASLYMSVNGRGERHSAARPIQHDVPRPV